MPENSNSNQHTTMERKMLDIQPIPIHAFVDRTADTIKPNPDAPELLSRLLRADVIFGHDWATGRDALFYGRDLMKQIVATGVCQQARILKIGMDLTQCDDLELLAALVEVTKGQMDYEDRSL